MIKMFERKMKRDIIAKCPFCMRELGYTDDFEKDDTVNCSCGKNLVFDGYHFRVKSKSSGSKSPLENMAINIIKYMKNYYQMNIDNIDGKSFVLYGGSNITLNELNDLLNFIKKKYIDLYQIESKNRKLYFYFIYTKYQNLDI